jgi:hypothetical protein
MVKEEPNDKDIGKSLNFLECNSENELNDVIELNWDKVRCFKCGKIISLETCSFINQEVPVCRGGCYG